MSFAVAIRLALPMGSPTGGGPHPVAPWLLQTGVWNNAGVWLDSATWTEWLLNGGVWSDIGVWADSLTWEDGTPAFSAGGVNFDGTAFLNSDSLIATDNGFFSFSYWFKLNDDTNSGYLFVVDPLHSYTNNGFVAFNHTFAKTIFDDIDSTNSLSATAPGLSSGAWFSLIGTVSTDHPDGSKILKLFLNGADVTTSVTDGSAAFTMTYNGLPFYIGNDTFDPSDYFVGDMAEVWIAPGQSLLTAGTISPATLAKFRDVGTGSPVDLGSDGSTPTGTAPAIYMHRSTTDAASAFATNLGTGGSFATTGTLTASSTNP